MCPLTHSVLFLKCDLIQNKLKVEQIVHSWELYTVYNFSVCVCKLFVYCVHSQSPHSEQHMAVFLLSLHFKDNTVLLNTFILTVKRVDLKFFTFWAITFFCKGFECQNSIHTLFYLSRIYICGETLLSTSVVILWLLKE